MVSYVPCLVIVFFCLDQEHSIVWGENKGFKILIDHSNGLMWKSMRLELFEYHLLVNLTNTGNWTESWIINEGFIFLNLWCYVIAWIINMPTVSIRRLPKQVFSRFQLLHKLAIVERYNRNLFHTGIKFGYGLKHYIVNNLILLRFIELRIF